jgi:hypothetical protein
VKIELSGRLAKVPAIGLGEVLLMTVKTVPCANGWLPRVTKEKSAPVLTVTPSAVTLLLLAVLVFSLQL